MSPRTGRPKTENPINIRTSVRLDAETDRKLNDYCEKHGIIIVKEFVDDGYSGGNFAEVR